MAWQRAELRNAVERAVVLGLPVTPEGAVGHEPDAEPSALLEDVERRHIQAVLRATKGVVEGPKGATRALGLRPSTLRHRMRKLGVTREGDG